MSLFEIPIPDRAVIVFDLDDTLYEEREFVESGFRAVANQLFDETGQSVYDMLLQWRDLGEPDPFRLAIARTDAACSKAELLKTYREHNPTLQQNSELLDLLQTLKKSGHPLGVLTDGRSTTQRNKLRSLGVDQLVDEIVISEEFGSTKPDERNYLHFTAQFPNRTYMYVADNPEKDFVTPNRLDWITVCLLDHGSNIHPQNFESLPLKYRPHYRVHRLF